MIKDSSWATIFLGHIVNSAIDESFDFILYPLVLAYFGLIKGGAIMWVLSFVFCYLSVLFYNWSKKDWLGIEMVKTTLEKDHTNFFMKALAYANKKGKWAVMLLLSVTTDPFICMIYMRRSTHTYNKMSRRDWKIFLTSFVLANFWWTFVMFTGVSIIKYLYIYISIHI